MTAALDRRCPFCGAAPGQLCRSRHGRETNALHSRRIRLALPDLSHAPGTRISVAPADKDAKLHEDNGKLFMYVGRITVTTDNLTVTPCRNISEKQLRELVAWVRTGKALPPEPGRWRQGPNGWTTHVSVPVDGDEAIGRALKEAEATR